MHQKNLSQMVIELKEIFSATKRLSPKIESKLGTRDCHDYLKSLLIKHNRFQEGFDKEVYMKIMHLYMLHTAEFGDFGEPLILTEPNLNTYVNNTSDQ